NLADTGLASMGVTVNPSTLQSTFSRSNGSFLADGFVCSADQCDQKIYAFGFGPDDRSSHPYHVVSVTSLTLTVSETLTPWTATGTEELMVQGDRGKIMNGFISLQDAVSG